MEDFDLIDDYLLGQLPPEKAQAVEERLRHDPSFAAAMAEQADILQGVSQSGTERIKKTIADTDRALADEGFFDTQYAPRKNFPTAQKPFLRFFFLLLALTAGFLFWWKTRTPQVPIPEEKKEQPLPDAPPAPNPNAPQNDADQPKAPNTPDKARDSKPNASKQQPQANAIPNRYMALAQQRWQAPDYALRSENAPPASTIHAAEQAFQNKDYSRVLALLSDIKPDDARYWQASEMIAHAYFLSGQTQQAAARFKALSDSRKPPYAERADWHLLLCYLADYQHNKENFETLLQLIKSDKDHAYGDMARELTW